MFFSTCIDCDLAYVHVSAISVNSVFYLRIAVFLKERISKTNTCSLYRNMSQNICQKYGLAIIRRLNKFTTGRHYLVHQNIASLLEERKINT